ncbi:hypothetical protein [Kutzneria albida]|uniref:Uncharacterized protein n=1 Tax=Kutzneria albida DSM 43870 TaxID=1449976 RepID=W5WCK8_9PSEU|nr:hypothetical protein [Kutzneria albida]AHH98276.1 hypothetical protein KALB_4914 [Kutzneria albida DSM 43870]
MTTTTTARRICRSVNHHAAASHTRNASLGGIEVYFDAIGHEVTWTESGHVIPDSGLPFEYTYRWTVRPDHRTTAATVQDELGRYTVGVIA